MITTYFRIVSWPQGGRWRGERSLPAAVSLEHFTFVFRFSLLLLIVRELAGIDAGPTTETLGRTSGSPNPGANPGIAGVGALDEFRRSFLNDRWQSDAVSQLLLAPTPIRIYVFVITADRVEVPPFPRRPQPASRAEFLLNLRPAYTKQQNRMAKTQNKDKPLLAFRAFSCSS